MFVSSWLGFFKGLGCIPSSAPPPKNRLAQLTSKIAKAMSHCTARPQALMLAVVRKDTASSAVWVCGLFWGRWNGPCAAQATWSWWLAIRKGETTRHQLLEMELVFSRKYLGDFLKMMLVLFTPPKNHRDNGIKQPFNKDVSPIKKMVLFQPSPCYLFKLPSESSSRRLALVEVESATVSQASSK